MLIHTTGSCISLLKHLGATDISLISTAEDIPEGMQYGFTLGTMRLGSEKSEYYPGLDRNLSRKDIVLTAADKDGGAHVDKALTEEYEALASEGSIGRFIYFSKGVVTKIEPITNAHFVAIRQMAYELLNSSQLLQLKENS